MPLLMARSERERWPRQSRGVARRIRALQWTDISLSQRSLSAATSAHLNIQLSKTVVLRQYSDRPPTRFIQQTLPRIRSADGYRSDDARTDRGR